MPSKVTGSLLWLLVPIWVLLSSSAWGEIRQTDNVELERLLRQGVPLIDVGTAKEWMDTGVMQRKPFILICDVGVRTDAISRVLHNQLHYQKVYNVTRGIRSLITSGHEAVRPPMVIRINP